MVGTSAKTSFGENPFVGPRPFEEGRRIFGRDREIEDLYNLLSAERIVLLYSPSGAGKSSLIQAGLIPRLRSSGRFDVWKITRVNQPPEEQPQAAAGVNRYLHSAMRGFEQGVIENLRRPPEEIARMTLAEYVAGRPRRPSAPQNIVLIFDQFEEILTADPLAVEAKREFFRQLGELLLAPNVWALFALREDYLAALDPYAEQVPTHLQNGLRLDLLRRNDAREAITGTAAEGGRKFDPAAVEKLVRDLATMKVQQPDGTFVKQTGLYVEPLQLQVVSRGLWERMPASKQTIDLADIEQFGDVTDALSGYYSGEVARIAAGDVSVERAMREWVGDRLITPDGIRSQVLKGAGKSEGLENELIASLVNTHLVRGEQRDGATWYELAHDRLIEPVRGNNRDWFDAHLHKVQKDAAAWESQGRPTSLLLLGADLVAAKQWSVQNKSSLTPLEHEFLEASNTQQQQTAMRQRLVVILGAVALLALIAIGTAYAAFRKAANEAGSARAAKLEAVDLKERADAAIQKAKEAQAIAEDALQVASEKSKVAYEQTEAANEATVEAERQRKAADQITYVANLNLAGAESGKGNRQRVFQILDAYLPANGSAQDQSNLRNFYWYYLWRQNFRGSTLAGHGAPVTSVAFLPDGQTLVSSDWSDFAKWWDVRNSVQRPAPDWQLAIGRSINFSRDGRIIASTGGVWDLQRRRKLFDFEAHGYTYIHAVILSPDGQKLASADGNGKIKLWDVKSQKEITTLSEHKNAVSSLAFSPNGRTLASASWDGTVKLWNLDQLNEAPITLGDPGFSLHSVAFSSDGHTIAAAGQEQVVKLWDTDSRKSFATLKGHGSTVNVVAFSPDGRTLVSGSDDKTIKLWDVLGRKELITLSEHEDNILSLAFSSDGRMLASGSRDKKVKLWDLQSRRDITLLPGGGGDIGAVVFSPDGRTLAGGIWDEVKLWDMQTPKEPMTLGKHEKQIKSLAFSPDGRLLASGGNDQAIKLWDARQRQEIALLGRQGGDIQWLAFATDGRTLLSASENQTIKRWNVERYRKTATLSGQQNNFSSVAFSPDRRTLARADDDNIVTLWDVASGSRIATLGKHNALIWSLVFSPDGRTLATASVDKTVKLWHVPARMEMVTLSGHTEPVLSLAFSPDGRTLASGGGDKAVKLWDMQSHKEIASLSTNAGSVWALAFSSDGRTLAVGHDSGTITLWIGASDQDVEAFRPRK